MLATSGSSKIRQQRNRHSQSSYCVAAAIFNFSTILSADLNLFWTRNCKLLRKGIRYIKGDNF